MTNWEASWGHVGGNWDSQDGTKLGQVEAKLTNFGTNLGPSWALLGEVGPCWGHVGTRLGQVGTKLGQLGLSWVQFVANFQLGPSWSQVGPSWAKLGLCWQILAGSWQSQRKVTPHVAENHQRWTQRAQLRPQKLDFGRVLGFMLTLKISKKVKCIQKVRSS